MKKLAGYVRVSTADQVEGESPEIQRKKIKEFAKYHEYELVNVYEDLGKSGVNMDRREQFQRLVEDAHLKKFDAVVVTDMSRCARNSQDLLNFINDDLVKNDIIFLTTDGKIDSTDPIYGMFFLEILSSIASLERKQTIERTQRARRKKWSDKRCFVGRPPFGFTWSRETCEMEINPEEQAVYNKMVDWYLDLGLSYKDIAFRLTEEGVLCKNKPFSSITIGYCFKNPAYYGSYIVNKYKYINGKRSKELRPESEWIKFKIPAMIDKTKWDRLQAKIEFNRRKTKRTYNSEAYFLRDVLRCNECGGIIKPHHGAKRKDGTFPRYYSCYWSFCAPKVLKTERRKKCHLPLMKADELEKMIWTRINLGLGLGKDGRMSDLIDPDKYDKQLEQLDKKVKNFKNRLKQAKTAKTRLYDAYETGRVDLDELSNRLNIRDDEILNLESKISDTEKEASELQEVKNNDQLLRDFLENEDKTLVRLKQSIHKLGPDDKKRLVESMVDIILIEGDSRENYWVPTPFKLRFNKLVLLDLIDQNKLPSLTKNGAYHTPSDDI